MVVSFFKSITGEDDIHATPARVYPQYKEGMRGSKIVGYIATNTITGHIRNLELIQQAVQKINTLDQSLIQVSSLQFDIENKFELENQARQIAFADAKCRAETYGKEIGLHIKKVKSIEENLRYNSTARHPSGKFGITLHESNDFTNLSSHEETLETGNIELTVEVQVCFKLGEEVSNCPTN